MACLLEPAELNAVVVGVADVGVHRDRVTAVPLVVGVVVDGVILRVGRRRRSSDRIRLE